MSIRLRLTLMYAAALGVTLLAAGGVAWWQAGEALRAPFLATLQVRAAGVAATLENNGQGGVQETDAPNGGTFVAILDANGSMVDASSNLPSGIPLRAGYATVDGNEYLLYADRAADGSQVLAGASTASLGAARNDLARALLLGGGFAAAISLGAGFLIARRALRPVDRMTAEAAQIGSRDLEWRVQEPRNRDELGRLARTLNAMLERIAGSVDQQRAFVAEASHDLRTPLAALRAELELADRPDATVDELHTAMRSAQIDAGRLASVADALLQRAMDPGERHDALRRPAESRDVVEASILRVSLPARMRGVRVLATVGGGAVVVDRLRIEQAIANLLQNAVAQGPRGSTVQLNSRMLLDAAGPSWLVEILDRGPGLRDRSLDDLLGEGTSQNPAARALRNRRGFGLASVRGAIEAHGGRLGAENRADGGARFWFSVPI